MYLNLSQSEKPSVAQAPRCDNYPFVENSLLHIHNQRHVGIPDMSLQERHMNSSKEENKRNLNGS